MRERLKPREPHLWSDFDGTAVEIARARYINPKNWAKMGLRVLPGYIDFLRGVQDAGVQIDGVVSRRPDVWPRRFATQFAINYQDLYPFFDPPARVVLTGSEERKASVLVNQAWRHPIGVLEDKPHKIGPMLIEQMLKAADDAGPQPHPITIGVVEHEKTDKRIAELDEIARTMDGISRVGFYDEGSTTYHATELGHIPLVKVIALGPYDELAGVRFAEAIRVE